MYVLQGNKVKLTRFKVCCDNEIYDCNSRDSALALVDALKTKYKDINIEEIDQKGNEWLEDLEFNSFNEVDEAIQMGEQTYKQKLELDKITSTLKLRADLDYVLITLGVL